MSAGSKITLQEILSGIDHREFFFHFQPIFELLSGGQVGSEMLIRWIRGGDVLLPGLFFPVLEANHMFKNLDQYVFQQVHDLDWEAALRPDFRFRVFINASSETVADLGFLAAVEPLIVRLKSLELIPVIELSESSLFEQRSLEDNMREVRVLGAEIALDDFGVGHSSLARLVNLPLDILKVDRHFTANIGQSARGETVLESILGMAVNIGLKCVVEGVETEAQADWLRCHAKCWVQGYYYGYPLPMDFCDMDRQGSPQSV